MNEIKTRLVPGVPWPTEVDMLRVRPRAVGGPKRPSEALYISDAANILKYVKEHPYVSNSDIARALQMRDNLTATPLRRLVGLKKLNFELRKSNVSGRPTRYYFPL